MVTHEVRSTALSFALMHVIYERAEFLDELIFVNLNHSRKSFKMALETIDRAPQVGHYTLLSQHQEQTPGTFYGAKPILHLHSPAAQIKISQEDLESQPTFAGLKDETDTTDDEGQSIISNVDVWIASE